MPETGTITIGGQTIPIAIGTTIANANLIQIGANICLSGNLNSAGQIVPLTTTASLGASSTLNVCGVVSSYTAATATTPGSVTIGGTTIPIAAGATINGAGLLTSGANVCIAGTLNATGQLINPTAVTATTTLNVCGIVSNYTAAMPAGETRSALRPTELFQLVLFAWSFPELCGI